MNLPSSTIEKAVEQLSRFPGIGKKTALRMTLFLLKNKVEDVDRMVLAIKDLKDKVKFCSQCGNVADQEVCTICTSVNREKQTVCVVKDFQDIIALENTGQYSGIYHVLGGLISPMEGIGPDDIKIQQLLNRVEKEGIQEVVLALSATMEGETTAFYISRKLEGSEVKISAIARGISVGGELEYADEITLGRSIQNRLPYAANLG
ncbi:MAG: recombination protein RecR [Bacteroidia bacterium]|jgi:recombination protein RecR